MKVYLATLGCRLNEAEIEAWARELAAAGHGVAPNPAEAEIIALNSCAVTAEAARKTRKLVHRLHRRNPSAPLVLTGCYASLEAEKAAELAGVDLVLSNQRKDDLVRELERLASGRSMPRQAQSAESSVIGSPGRTRAFLKVQDGCRNRCTFCVVTIARGEERSRPIHAVVDEINALHQSGFQEVVLTGVHLGGYGQDLGTDLASLVDAVVRNTSIPRIRLSSLEPWELPAHLWSRWADRRLCPHLHLPLQSGSDRILRRMSRHYDSAGYARLVESARAAIPDLVVTTDVIVGFPGESDEDFASTLALCRQIGFAHLHIFAYSPREGTAAARMPDHISDAVKSARSQAMHEVGAGTKEAQLRRFVGSVRPVLWEGAGEALSLDSGSPTARRWTGLTDNYLRVRTVAPPRVDLENRITPALLVHVEGEHLVAQISPVPEEPSSKIERWA